SATCAVNATRRGGDDRTRPSRRATTERNPSAPTTTRLPYVSRFPRPSGSPLGSPERPTTAATVPWSKTRFSTVTHSRTSAPARASSKAVVAPAGPAPTTTTSQRLVTTSSRSGRRNVRAEHGRGGSDERRGEVHAVVVEPSPTSRQSHRLVTHGIPALEPRVAG